MLQSGKLKPHAGRITMMLRLVELDKKSVVPKLTEIRNHLTKLSWYKIFSIWLETTVQVRNEFNKNFYILQCDDTCIIINSLMIDRI